MMLPSLTTLATAGEFMDVWVTTAFEDQNALAGPTSGSPPHFVERGNSTFFENYENRYTDDISPDLAGALPQGRGFHRAHLHRGGVRPPPSCPGSTRRQRTRNRRRRRRLLRARGLQAGRGRQRGPQASRSPATRSREPLPPRVQLRPHVGRAEHLHHRPRRGPRRAPPVPERRDLRLRRREDGGRRLGRSRGVRGGYGQEQAYFGGLAGLGTENRQARAHRGGAGHLSSRASSRARRGEPDLPRARQRARRLRTGRVPYQPGPRLDHERRTAARPQRSPTRSRTRTRPTASSTASACSCRPSGTCSPTTSPTPRRRTARSSRRRWPATCRPCS